MSLTNSAKAVFIDRDDTLIEDPGDSADPRQLKLLPGVCQSLIQLKKLGYLIFIITNQPGIAKGLLSEQQLGQIHQTLRNMLMAEGAGVDGIYYCPYHPEGTVSEYAVDSDLRKPQPGMLLKAAREHAIELNASWMIGDSFRDIRAGKAAGCQTIMVDVPGKPREKKPDDPEPDRKAVNIREAVNIIRMYEFHQKARTVKPSAEAAELPEHQQPVPIEVQKPAAKQAREQSQEIPAVVTAVPSAPVAAPAPAPAEKTTPAESISPKVYTAKKTPAAAPEQTIPEPQTHKMLEEVLLHLKHKDRQDLYREFSIFKLLALMFQAVGIFCILASIWFWLSPDRGTDSVLIMIGYAVVLQLAVIALMMYSSE